MRLLLGIDYGTGGCTTTVLDGIKCRVSRSDDVGGSAGILAETACAAFAIVYRH